MIGRILNSLIALAGGAGLTQFPTYYQQYLQRLGGRLDQTRADVARMIADAESLGRSLEAYLGELMAYGTPEARQSAQRELERLDSVQHLEKAYEVLSKASPLERPVVFVEHFNPSVAQETLSIFTPAMQMNMEALAYGGAGMLLALVFFAGSLSLMRRGYRRVRGQPA